MYIMYIPFMYTLMCVCTIHVGVAGLEQPEQPTVIVSSSFFVTFLSLVESSDSIKSVVDEKGISLVQFVLQAIAGAAPRSYLPHFSDVLGGLRAHCFSQLSQWLEVREGHMFNSVCIDRWSYM